MTAPSSSSNRQTVATLARLVFVLAVVVGLTLAGVAAWGLLQVRSQEPAGDDVPLQGGVAVIAMAEGDRRTVYVDGRSLEEARCTVTAPDGSVQTLEGFDVVGRTPLGSRPLGDVAAEQSGDHRVECTGVQEASVGPAGGPGGVELAVPVLAGLFVVVGVLPIAVISLVVWRRARRS